MTRTIDESALTAHVDRSAVRAFRNDVASGSYGVAARRAAGWGGSILVFVIVGVAALVIGPAIVSGVAETGFSVTAFIPVAVVAAVIAGVLLIRHLRWARWLRLANFAAANGWGMRPETVGPSYPGLIFGQGRDRTASDRLYATNGRYFDIANYRYTTGSGKSSTTHRWQYVAVKLDRRLPHMVLDSRSNNGLFGSNLPRAFSRDQVLSLEGDFDRHFTLYCPREYERDALYVFTPDFMAMLIDTVSGFDVEIVDDWMFLYAGGSYEPLEAGTWRRFLRIVDTVAAKAIARSDNYRDDRMLPDGAEPLHAQAATANLVAPQGRRLRTGVQWGTIAVMACIAIGWLLMTMI
ncbi:hypothetical protein SAMN04489806_0755 [Paramicrobacterium humi]|uniref:DUF3137 domain-containing protein n=1 Tax=Paramicrobacterium humi TaxID=640635 RepID=A0A1H4JLC6_9MICO|nr:hypothetical protein [Microbacterium humi]SEB47073.1 hypothetical protein SAMN04489806_0755 [Microbacterium humi]